MRRVLVVGLLAAMACGGNDGPRTLPVRDVTVTAAATSLLVGATTQLTAQVTGTDGAVITSPEVTWSSLSPTIASVSSSGFVTALQAGQATLRATSGGRSGDLVLQVKNPPVASLRFDRDSAVLTLPAGNVTLVPNAKDAGGRAINNPTLFFSTDASKVASVTQLGVVTAVAAGTATISGTADGVTASIKVRVTAATTGTSPRITTVSPLVAGASATISGTNFASSVNGNTVLVEGVPATVTAATTTQLTITLPSTGWPCAADVPVALQVNANGESGVAAVSLRTAIARSLSVGQSLVLSNAADVRCNELASTGGSYLVTVYNPARASGAEASFVLRGAASAARASEVVTSRRVVTAAVSQPVPSRVEYPAIGTAQFAYWQGRQQAQRADATHAAILERSIEFARAAGSPSAAWRRFRSSTDGATLATSGAKSAVSQLGAITPLKIPNLDAANFCTSSVPIGARTAWVGTHAIIVEDTTTILNGTPTLAGQLDSLYAVVGQEFDTVMWPILTQNFGNPLAMDQQLSRTGKLVMLFSPRINAMAGGAVAGFVVSCDFFPVSQSPSSNVGEYFYAISPTSLAAGMTPGTRAAWYYSMRATIIHEAKHITAFGERYARNAPFEELWLEEGLARHAEEQFARGIYGVAWKGNTGYRQSVYCDVRPASPSAPECSGRPLLMRRHFDALYDYLRSPETYTVLGRAAPTDGSFYATAWSMARWMIDHYATTESAFLSALVQSSTSGVANLEARTQRSWEEMFGEWALALYTDDYPGVTFANPRLRFLTWNLRDEFKGMCVDFGPCGNNASTLFPLEYPMVPRPVTYGSFSSTVSFINSASFTSWLLSGTQSAPQVLELRNTAGGDPPAQLRVAIVRVQ